MNRLSYTVSIAIMLGSFGAGPASAVDTHQAGPRVTLAQNKLPAPGSGDAPFGSTRYFYQACKALHDSKNSEDLFRQGQCSGELIALSAVSEQLSSSLRFCSPASVTVGELASAFEAYLDAKPDQMNRPFVDVALAALRAKWRCR